jgi:hypothetical protein
VRAVRCQGDGDHELNTLRTHDLLEIMFKNVHALSLDELRPRWIVGQVIEPKSGSTWPLLQLSDGQVTELRPYMKWRLVGNAGS